MDRLLLDLRFAIRRMIQNPGFSAVAILTLALGIGANTAMFSAINAVVFRSLPAARSSELIAVNQKLGGETVPSFSYPDYRDLRDRNTVLSGLVGFRIIAASLGVPGSSQRVWGYMVSGNYFDVLGVNAAAGRVLHPEDDVTPGAHPVAVLSYAFWQKRFAGDPGIVGQNLKFNGRDYTVLGVAPRGFFGTELYFSPDIFFPMMMQKELEGGAGYLDKRQTSNIFVVGRRKPGIGSPQAEAGLNSVAKQLAQEYPQTDSGLEIIVTPPGLAGGYLRGAVVGFALALFGVSSLVLLVACTNLSSLLLARAADRRKETAIRLALGADRMRLVRQLLTESLVVALVGGCGGALLAVWITSALASWRPPVDVPLRLDATVDTRVFLFALLVSVVTTLVFGLLPALQATKTDLAPALKNGMTSDKLRRWHLRDYMVATQVGLSTLLLVCSVLVVRSLQRALDAPLGYNPNGAVTASFDLNLQGYDEARGRQFQKRLIEKVRALPGIESAALVDNLPLSLGSSSDSIFIEGKPKPKASEAPVAYDYAVSTDYFRTMQTTLLAGRDFDLRDKQGAKEVAIVNRAFADRLLAGDDAIGKRFSLGEHAPPIEIIGVVQDGKYFSLAEDRKPALFRPLDMSYSQAASLVARTKLNPNEAVSEIRAAVRELDPALPLYSVGTLTAQLDLPLLPARIAASALSAFGFLAVILAATGIYGVMAYAVARRTREIGIRMAIGASSGQVLGLVAKRAMLLIGSGMLGGLALALATGRLLGQILYGVEPTDPLSFGVVFVSMVAIAALASWLPARRAIQIDPIRALRQE